MGIPSDQRTWVEIDRSAFVSNLAVARKKVGPKAGIVAVVKADGYGHGAKEVAEAVCDQVALLAVANLGEALELDGFERDILILSPSLPSERGEIVERGYIATVSSAAEAAAYIGGRVNFKIDTGMGRIGCWHEQALAELGVIAALEDVDLHGISTHLPDADGDAAFTRDQLEQFARLANDCRKIAPGVKIHALNSAGILGFSEHGHDLVRLGLALYGSACPAEYQSLLRPALTWKARIVLVRDVACGRTVSYGRTFITPQPTRIATLAVGYADGFPRHASGQNARVLVDGQRCTVLGRVTMDQILIDVSSVSNCAVGDEAVLIGRQGKGEIFAGELAGWAGTVAWEIFTGIGGRSSRFYI